MTDVTDKQGTRRTLPARRVGVAIRPPEAVTYCRPVAGRWELRIATPACALVRNDKLGRFRFYLADQ